MEPSGAPESTAPRPSRVDLRYVGHATVLIEVGRVRILTDPFLRHGLGPLERHGPAPDLTLLDRVDLILVSHGHPDHFDRTSLARVVGAHGRGRRPVLVVPRGLGDTARRALDVDAEIVEMVAGDRAIVAGVEVNAIPARHWISPGAPRAQPVGYLLDAGRSLYFAGDTGRVPAMRDLAGAVDVALLPVWTWGPHLGPGHLGPRSAAEALVDIAPRFAVPIHWGTLYPRRLHRVWRSPLSEPGDRFAGHASRLAPDVDVRVLRPGEDVGVDLPPR
jgi:L-ascorbate metabolism protein UlaG (beta-lactamase superfamily)